MKYKVTALTPLLVGDGRELSPIDYMVWKDQVNVLDQNRIFRLLARGPGWMAISRSSVRRPNSILLPGADLHKTFRSAGSRLRVRNTHPSGTQPHLNRCLSRHLQLD